MHFVAAYQRGTYLAQSRVISISLVGDWAGAGDWSNDLAILHLAKPIGDIAGFVPAGALPEGISKAVKAGYRADAPHVLSVDHGCPITAVKNATDGLAGSRLAVHGCAAAMGRFRRAHVVPTTRWPICPGGNPRGIGPGPSHAHGIGCTDGTSDGSSPGSKPRSAQLN